MTLLEEIKNLKANLELTNEEISHMSGIPYGTVTKIMSGQTKSPGSKTLEAIKSSLYDFIESEDGNIDITLGGKIFKSKKNIKDYYSLPDDKRVELINGDFFEMAAPSTFHQTLVGNLYFKIRLFIEMHNGACKPLLSPIDVQLNKDDFTIVQPDLIIVCDSEKIKERLVYGAPDFCLEVVSPSSRSRDYFLKASLYKNAGVKEYWIVDSEKEKVIVYSNLNDDEGSDISIYSFKDEIPLGIIDGLILTLE